MNNIAIIKKIIYMFFVSVFVVAFVSCTSSAAASPPPRQQPQTPPRPQTQAPQGQPQQQTPAARPVQPAANQPASQAAYQRTFQDIQEFIRRLNRIISDSNYDEWRRHLSQSYIDYYSNPATLRQISQAPALIRNNITLRTLRDYFIYVVVPSRSNVRLDSISVIDDTHTRAFMMIGGDSVLLYNLVRDGNSWKVDR